MPLPTFLIAGAPRSGTTWLVHLCDAHPQIYMAKPLRPEPKFFLVDALYAHGLAYYAQRWFADTGDATAIGEKSTNYLESATAARRIRRDLPGVRLVFILRNPIDRAYSNYAWSRMHGHEPLSFAEALAAEAAREGTGDPALRYARPHAYFSRGLYADLLAPYLDLFPREQLLILTFEEAVARPALTAAQLHVFLGVPPRPDLAGTGPVNQSQPPPDELSPDLRQHLAERYRAPNARLAAATGLDVSIWDRAALSVSASDSRR